ncbi:hypothetical protein ABI59_16560 [Acidobacteria bacterium Mor1]|nr:hypothetical protein ABI59_16560 [Acidobacteria bacterium Mor1]
MSSRKSRTGSKNGASRRPWRTWTRWTDDKLLDLRLCDLDLKLERTEPARRVNRLYEELEERGIHFRPHVWLSSEWFSPDASPGIAVPFYLAHPRLERLEQKQMLVVEGGTQSSCMRILRHEAGHAIDTAYRLHYRKRWRETFGRWSEPYPDYYRPRPNSRNFVVHLDAWYAQAHPAEDWAETFAVWLTPRSGWRRRYKDWPKALKKLEYVDELMHEIAGQPPKVRSRACPDRLSTQKQTLGEHYAAKRSRYEAKVPRNLERDLRRLFSDDPRYCNRPTAASFLRGMRKEIQSTVARWTGAHNYAVDQILQDMIDHCKQRKLRMTQAPRPSRMQAVILVTVQTMTYMRTGRFEIAL